MYRFTVIETQGLFLGRSYGILAADGRGRALVVPGLSRDKERVSRLADRCADRQLDLERLLEAVLDACWP